MLYLTFINIFIFPLSYNRAAGSENTHESYVKLSCMCGVSCSNNTTFFVIWKKYISKILFSDRQLKMKLGSAVVVVSGSQLNVQNQENNLAGDTTANLIF